MSGLVDRYGRPLVSGGRRQLIDRVPPDVAQMMRLARLTGATMMGTSTAPLSAESKQLTEQLATTSDINGNATWTFDAPPQGTTWTGTLNCQGAPATAVFNAQIGATQWGDWAGSSIAGPVQAFGNQRLVINAVGLSPSTSYLMVWTGASELSDTVAPIWPEPNTSAQTVQFSEGTVLFNGSTTTGTGPQVQVPPQVRTLIIKIGGASLVPVSLLQVVGQFTDFNYYDQAPYLPGNLVIVPVVAIVDTFIFVTPVFSGGGSAAVQVWGDTAEYQESIFYNGVPFAQTTTGVSGTFIAGPRRLLSWSLSSIAGGEGSIGIGATNVQSTAVAVVNPNQTVSGHAPDPGLICPTNQDIWWLNGGGLGDTAASIVSAYP